MVACEVVVPAPPEEAFRWFARPELLVRWIGIDARLEPRPGGLFRFEVAEGEWCSGRYLEVVPGRRVVVTWGLGQRGNPGPARFLDGHRGPAGAPRRHPGPAGPP